IDQAAAKGILKKNTAARKKSSLNRKLNAVNA
ncbi:MAG: 30S ribosomal protein S20, partial [Oscillospiraceae bacterium]|nr:30S ribosomal protein S20 [Oscillospiraceae bacterium]